MILTRFWPLLLALPIMAILLLIYYNKRPLDARHKFYLALRTAALAFLILALCAPYLHTPAKDSGTLFVVDMSRSTEKSRAQMRNFVTDALKTIGAHDQYGVIVFGADATVELPLDKANQFNGFQVSVDHTATNIEQAVQYATMAFDKNIKKRIVLITDGAENAGDVRRKLSGLTARDIQLDIYSVAQSKNNPEVQLKALNLPSKVNDQQVIQLEAIIESNVQTSADIYVYQNDQVIARDQLNLAVGETNYVYNALIEGAGGIVDFSVEVVPQSDGYTENNKLATFTEIDSSPRILLIQNGNAGQNFKTLLSGAQIDVRQAEEASGELANLVNYDAFILANVSLETLAPEVVEQLELLVREQGKGLLVSGGDSSYALGGYYQTTLEKMLPVTMDITDEEQKQNLALVLIVDKSGSMQMGQYGVSKLQLAKEAAARSTEILDKQDFLGVIAFDDTAKWVVNLSAVSDKQAMQNAIGTIVTGGGTVIKPSVMEAVKALSEVDAKNKHIILLTDGQGEGASYQDVLSEMQNQKITISTVAVGGDADSVLLKSLAEKGSGRYYATSIFTDIPSIFTKEAVLAGKKYLNNIEFYPKIIGNPTVLSGIDALPSLDGYVATTAKSNSKVLLSGPQDDPILASYQYGLGRTMAWMSDMDGMWTTNWLAWSDQQIIWQNIMSHLVQRDINRSYDVSSSYQGGEALLTLQSDNASALSGAQITGEVIMPDGQSQTVTLTAVEPGVYQTALDAVDQGIYLANLTVLADGETHSVATALSVPYSREFDYFNRRVLSAQTIADLSGGRVLSAGDEVFKGQLPEVASTYALTNLLLALTLLLFLTELLYRMSNLALPVLPKINIKALQKSPDKQSAPETAHTKKSANSATKQPEVADDYLDVLLKKR